MLSKRLFFIGVMIYVGLKIMFEKNFLVSELKVGVFEVFGVFFKYFYRGINE